MDYMLNPIWEWASEDGDEDKYRWGQMVKGAMVTFAIPVNENIEKPVLNYKEKKI